MICTVTLNASIDKSYRLAAPLADHTVMRVASCHATAGGKGLNAARAVAACGEEVVASGIVGGHTGQLLLDLLAADGVAGDFVHARGETRTCINVLDPDGGSTVPGAGRGGHARRGGGRTREGPRARGPR